MRREGDSNPRNAFGVYTLSRRASSTTRASLHTPKRRLSHIRVQSYCFFTIYARICAFFCIFSLFYAEKMLCIGCCCINYAFHGAFIDVRQTFRHMHHPLAFVSFSPMRDRSHIRSIRFEHNPIHRHNAQMLPQLAILKG